MCRNLHFFWLAVYSLSVSVASAFSSAPSQQQPSPAQSLKYPSLLPSKCDNNLQCPLISPSLFNHPCSSQILISRTIIYSHTPSLLLSLITQESQKGEKLAGIQCMHCVHNQPIHRRRQYDTVEQRCRDACRRLIDCVIKRKKEKHMRAQGRRNISNQPSSNN